MRYSSLEQGSRKTSLNREFELNQSFTNMNIQLPIAESFLEDRSGYRVWKRLFRHAGKQLAFNVLEPKIRASAVKIRNRIHPVF